jgi:hypothetical protein
MLAGLASPLGLCGAMATLHPRPAFRHERPERFSFVPRYARSSSSSMWQRRCRVISRPVSWVVITIAVLSSTGSRQQSLQVEPLRQRLAVRGLAGGFFRL